MKMLRFTFPVIGAVALASCAVVPPSYPTVMALPASGKSIQAFQADDVACRAYAAQVVDPVVAAHPAADSGIGAPALGAAGGAAAGALIGAGAGNAGAGAAIGAGAGLLLGSAAGLRQHRNSEAALQRQYDNAYSQCMITKGDSIDAPPVPRPPVVMTAPAVIYAPAPYYYVPYY
ncbi:glycine zipper domain-containing protein [Paraburkholderia heleia]|uniref:glycine zipper domain-containing protein n=1 Tax=Paraburkholderia heleia TaxID=634127 RepID=UPI0005A6EADE|nr:glycine zipper domain-containing protein [Paraburkholderia heleia]